MSRREWGKKPKQSVDLRYALHLVPGETKPDVEPASSGDPLQRCCGAVHRTMLMLGVQSSLTWSHKHHHPDSLKHAYPELMQIDRVSGCLANQNLSHTAVFVYEPGAIVPASLTDAAAVIYVANTLPSFDADAAVVAELMRMADYVVFPHPSLRDMSNLIASSSGVVALTARFPHIIALGPVAECRDIDVLWVGRDVPRKNLDGFVRFAENAGDWVGKASPTVHVVSKVDYDRKEELRKKGLEVHNQPFSPSSMSELFSRTRFLVHTATAESSPRVIIEALSAGCNVLVPHSTTNGWQMAWDQTVGVRRVDLYSDVEPLPGDNDGGHGVLDRRLAGLAYCPSSEENLREWADVCKALSLPMI